MFSTTRGNPSVSKEYAASVFRIEKNDTLNSDWYLPTFRGTLPPQLSRYKTVATCNLVAANMYWYLGETRLFHPQGRILNSPVDVCRCFVRMSTSMYQTIPRQAPEDNRHNFHSHHYKNLKILVTYFRWNRPLCSMLHFWIPLYGLHRWGRIIIVFTIKLQQEAYRIQMPVQIYPHFDVNKSSPESGTKTPALEFLWDPSCPTALSRNSCASAGNSTSRPPN
jgi:hypothetical protein